MIPVALINGQELQALTKSVTADDSCKQAGKEQAGLQ
jgi:hypothetical protein